MAKRLRLRVTGEHYTHQRLWRTATYLHGLGAADEAGCYYTFLAATVFSYFAFEAFLNELGRKIATAAWENEREIFATGEFSGKLGKFRYLASIANLIVATGRRPFQTVRELATVRDSLVHARTEEVDIILRTTDLNAVGVPPAKLDRYGSAEFATQCLEDVEAVANQLMKAVFERYGDTGVGHLGHAFEGVDGMHQAKFE